MFGLIHTLTDPSLYLLSDMTEDLLSSTEKEILEAVDAEVIGELLNKIEWYKSELKAFEKNIEEKRQTSFQFSIEEMFYHHGQFDNFISIYFHKYSESAKKFGRSISGIIVYGKKERRELQDILTEEPLPRTNGMVKIRAATNSQLDEDQLKELLDFGFKSGDIYQIWSTNGPKSNEYLKDGKKKIPHTISIKLPSTTPNIAELAIFTFNMRLQSGASLIQSEWDRYYGFCLFLQPELKGVPKLKDDLYDNHGNLKEAIRFYELGAKAKQTNLSDSELDEFRELLKKRRKERFKLLENELKRAGIPSIAKFRLSHNSVYNKIFAMAVVFEDESLNGLKPGIPVFIDFQSYLHIHLGHEMQLQLNGAFKAKTIFSYEEKDIRRVLKIVIKKYWDNIQERLKQNKDFRLYGEKAFYFNGNYYSLNIDADGRVSSFYANERN